MVNVSYNKTYLIFVSVNVLCSEKVITGDYKVAFETFIETKLNRTVVWINTASDLNEREKYLLLCELKTRAPEDAEFEFERLGIKSKSKIILRNNPNSLVTCICTIHLEKSVKNKYLTFLSIIIVLYWQFCCYCLCFENYK